VINSLNKISEIKIYIKIIIFYYTKNGIHNIYCAEFIIYLFTFSKICELVCYPSLKERLNLGKIIQGGCPTGPHKKCKAVRMLSLLARTRLLTKLNMFIF